MVEKSFEVRAVGGNLSQFKSQNNMCELQKKIVGHNDLVLLMCTVVMLRTCNIA